MIDILNKCHTDPRFIHNDYLIFLFILLGPVRTSNFTLACVQTSPLPQKKSIFSEGGGTSVHRLTLHVPNLIISFGTCKVRRMNQLGTALLYLGRPCRSIRLSLSNRTPGIERQKIDFDSDIACDHALSLYLCNLKNK